MFFYKASPNLYRLGSFEDVKNKGRRLLNEHRFNVIEESTYSVLAEVEGDNGTYLTYVNNNLKVNKYTDNKMSYWECTCPWGEWAFSRETYEGRVCSHAYAMHLYLQSNRRNLRNSNVLEGVSMGITDEKKQELAFKAITEAVNQFQDEFIEYVDNGIALEPVINSAVEIATEFELPVNVLDAMITEAVKEFIAAEAEQLALAQNQAISELEAVVENIDDEIATLGIKLESIDDKQNPEPSTAEIIAKEILSLDEQEIIEFLENPIPYAEEEGLTEQETIDTVAIVIDSFMPDKKTASHVSWMVEYTWDELQDKFNLNELKAFFNDEQGVWTDEIADEIDKYGLFPEELAELTQVVKEAKLNDSKPASKKIAGFVKKAGRIFTEEEKLAILNELGIARQFIAGEFV